MGCEHSISKFQDEITHYLYELAMDDSLEDECGSVDYNGWYGLFDGPVIESDETLASIVARGEGYGNLTAWDVSQLIDCAGAIVECHSSGAIYSKLYRNTADLNADWKEIEDTATEPSEDED